MASMNPPADRMFPMSGFNPVLLKAAQLLHQHDGDAERALSALFGGATLEKAAIVPAGGSDPSGGGGDPTGGMGGGDPTGGMAGGAPAPAPADPTGGAGAVPAPAGPLPPDQIGQIAQQVAQVHAQAGMGGPGGKGGGKKAEQQIMMAMLRNILWLQAKMAEQAGIQVPPSMLVPGPNDPGIEQMAAQELQNASPMPNPAGGAPPADPSQGGAMPPGSGAPDPSGGMGGAPKMAGDVTAMGEPFDPGYGLLRISDNAALAALLIQQRRR